MSASCVCNGTQSVFQVLQHQALVLHSSLSRFRHLEKPIIKPENEKPSLPFAIQAANPAARYPNVL